MKRTVVAGMSISAVCIVLAGMTLWWRASRHAESSEAVAAMDATLVDVVKLTRTDESSTASVALAIMRDHSAVLDPLPPLDMPLAQALPELEQRARDGDRAAACRLAAERQTCASLEDDLIVHDRWLAKREQVFSAGIKGASSEEARQAFEIELNGRESRLNWKVKHCEGIPPADSRTLVEDWRRAAQLGSWAAMRDYASGAVFEWSNLLANVEQLSQYKNEAERMALAVASWGDVPMNLSLADAYSPYQQGHVAKSLLRQAVKPSAAMALAMYKRLQRGVALVDPSAETANAASSIDIRTRNEISFLESRMSEHDRARADEILTVMDNQWQPVSKGLWKGAELYVGEQARRSPRFSCGHSRDQ